MTRNTPITALMTKKVIVAELDTKFTDVQKLFTEYQVYHLPVVFDDKLLGILSVKDALNTYVEHFKELDEWSEDKINEEFKLKEIMTHDPTTLHYSKTVGDAVDVLHNAKFRSLPIVDDSGKIVGIVSNKDLVRVLASTL